jgi:hypothetical protein
LELVADDDARIAAAADVDEPPPGPVVNGANRRLEADTNVRVDIQTDVLRVRADVHARDLWVDG